MDKKYELLMDDTIFSPGMDKLYRIRALRPFGGVNQGDLGGYVQSELNLSHEGNAWVFSNAKVSCRAKVVDNARVSGEAEIHGQALISGEASVRDKAKVFYAATVTGHAQVCGNAMVDGDACVKDTATVSQNARVTGHAQVYGRAKVSDNARVGDFAQVYGNAWVYGSAQLSEDARVFEGASVMDNAKVKGMAQVYGEAVVRGTAVVCDSAKVYGEAVVAGAAYLFGNAQAYEEHRITCGFVSGDAGKLPCSLYAQVGAIPVNGKVVLAKRVKKIGVGTYASLYDEGFIYRDGRVAKVEDPDLSKRSCSSGLHLSNPLYWDRGDTLIACEVDLEDIITVQEGKVRVSKCLVLGELPTG